MKNKKFRVKLFVTIMLLFAFGWLQLYAAPAQANAKKVPLSIFSSAYEHIPGLEKSEKKIIKSVIRGLDLIAKKKKYHRGTIDVIDIDADKEGDYLIVFLMNKKSYDADIAKVTLAENYKFLHVEYGYVLQYGDSSSDYLPSTRACNCPDNTIEILLSTCETGIPTAVAGINYSYDLAVNAGYTAKKLLGSEENISDIQDWLCCPNLKYWGRIGHGYTGGIVLDDGNLTYSYFDGLPDDQLLGKILYFNSCQVFNNPLKSSILNKNVDKFIGGICSLYIGPSEEVFKCWNDKSFNHAAPPGGTTDTMCYWSEECESSTGYPQLGCHGCGGPGDEFPMPGPGTTYTLTVNVSGDGSVTLDPAGGTYADGTTVTLTANPTAGWTFSYWSGDLTGTQNPTTIFMDADKNVTANFDLVTDPPVADFTADATSVYVDQVVAFTDSSTNSPTSWSWDFGDGGTSTQQNPTHAYTAVGTYTVSLTAYNPIGSDTETKIDYITVSEAPIEYCTSSGNDQSYEWIAGVQVGDLDNSSGASGYSDFTNLTANLDAGANVSVALTPGFASSSYSEYWKIWIDYNKDGDFADSGEEVFSGNSTSTVTGSFTVPETAGGSTRMRVTMQYNSAPSSCGTFTYGEVEDYTANIIPTGQQPPIADFSASDTSIDVGDSVSFTDLSSNDPTSWAWSFSGGTPSSSTVQNPTITYNTAGTYTVSLAATNDAGSDTETKTNLITVTAPQPPVANFTASATTVSVGGSVSFTDTSTNNPTSWAWTFAGGTPGASTTQNPTVTYNTVGTYNVSLTATNAVGSDTETKTGYITVTAAISTVGITDVLSSSTTTANRRAMPFTMPEDGTITSVSMYHSGGSGDMILGVYDGESAPQNRLAVTATTAVFGSTDWQTINLISPAYVEGGSTVWLAWVYESNPGIRYTSGSPGRYDAGVGWSGGMPDPFGSGSQANYLYSIYATYTPGGTPPQYTLTTNTVGQGSITLDPAGGVYDQGTIVTLTADPDSGWQFDAWSGDLSGSTNPTTITMNSNKSVTATFSEIGTTGTVGITTVYSSTSTSGYRRAMPFTMPEDGTITSISMYHSGGSGGLIMGVYDGSSTPQNRIAVTPTATCSSTTGWQTVNLTTPVFVSGGSTVWLAWVYQSNPGIRYTTGSPGRYQSTQSWSGGMPDPFGSGSQTSYLYSIYATYNKN